MRRREPSGVVGVGCPYAYCLIFKGGSLVNLGELDGARELINRGMALARKQGDIETVGWGHMWSVWHAYAASDADEALAHAQQTVEIADRIGDSFSRAWSWQWLGVAEGMQGEWQRAIEALERSRAIAREHRTAVDAEGYRLAFLGEACARQGDGDRGCSLLERAVEAGRETGQPPLESFALATLARVLLDHRWPAARERIEAALAQALEITQGTEARGFEPMIHIGLAKLAYLLDDPERQAEELREAHRECTEIGAPLLAGRLASELAAPAR